MSTEQNKAIVRRWVEEGINQGNEEVFLEYLAPDVIDHYAPPGFPPGRDGWNLNRIVLRTGFPDLRFVEHELIAEGAFVVGRYTFHGTHQGEFFGVPASGKKVSFSNIHIMRLVDGQVVEHWG